VFGFSRPRLWGAAVLAALLLVAAFTVGLLVGRPSHPAEGSADVGFARDMSSHHAQAVEMGMIAYRNATLPDVRTLGGDIAITQEGQIGTMQTWLKSWGVGPNGSSPPMAWMPDGQRSLVNNLMPGMATRDEVAKLKAATGKDADILFLQYMLRHHLGGIHMVEGVLAENPSPEVRELAETMKKNQSGEITVMENLLSQLGAKPL
jgi:uncharacterized protein (DUF305 family)